MSLGPSGAKYLRSRVNRPDQPLSQTPEKLDQPKELQIPAGRTIPTTGFTGSSNKLDEYFQMAMDRFLKEPILVTVQPLPLGTQDVDMESVGTPDLDSWEYDPNDLGIHSPSCHNSGRAAVATAAIGSRNSSSLIHRVRISAVSDLKEFIGQDVDEDRARAWIGKVKSAFQRDQATEEGKCLTFGDLMVGSAKNWHRQLNRLTLLRLADVDELEKVLRARERAKSRQNRSAFGSKFRQKVSASALTAPARAADRTHPTRKVLQRIILAAAEEKLSSTGGASQNPDPARSRTKASEGPRILDRRSPGDRDHQDRERCSHCGSRKHTDLDCWKRLTYENCGKRGHPTDSDPQMVRSDSTRRVVPRTSREDVKLGRSPGWNPVRAERSRYCIYSYVNKATADRDKKKSDLRGNTCNLPSYTAKIASLPQISEFSGDGKLPICPTEGVGQRDPPAEGATATTPQNPDDEEEIYYHDSGDPSAGDLEVNLAVLPKIPISTTAKVSIEDLQIIWKKRHLLIGKGISLPPAAKGVVCDIDVGNAKPIALRTRKVLTRFREKVAGLIKGLLAAEIIRPWTLPWASPIVIFRKSNNLVNSLTRLIVYPMLLISDLLEDLDKTPWYCSLDMASCF
ncbi:reverse transcriptase [Phytophthora megakarya]|uniref:Reverse transcriptase n=1 Tax=Phytophthora megakarya TaxID=4795 RepID=A0A225W0R1_9STRA|nr:reverse transcriptase [Phytophthora megakarya]